MTLNTLVGTREVGCIRAESLRLCSWHFVGGRLCPLRYGFAKDN